MFLLTKQLDGANLVLKKYMQSEAEIGDGQAEKIAGFFSLQRQLNISNTI